MGAALGLLTKDPDAILDYTIDWSNWLSTDTIASSSFTVPAGLSQPQAATHDNTTATCWLSSGTAGEKYLITNRIVTAAGRTQDRSFVLQIAEE